MVTGPRKSSGYTDGQLSDSDWEADVLPLNYTRKRLILVGRLSALRDSVAQDLSDLVEKFLRRKRFIQDRNVGFVDSTALKRNVAVSTYE